MEAIHEAHGSIFFDYQMVEMPGEPGHLIPASGVSILSNIMGKTFPPVNPDPSPPGPAWLRKLLGDEYFREVFQVSIGDAGGVQYAVNANISESDFAQLTNLRELRNVFLGHLKIVTVGSGLKRPLKDADLAVLENLCELREVSLRATDITDTGLTHLRNLSNLEILYLESPDISDAGLQNLEGLAKLKHLVVTRTKVSHEGISELQKSLPNCKISGP